jgi:hypothetical protein
MSEDQWIHEGSKLEDYSLSGACFLAMAELRIGMEIIVSIKPPDEGERLDLRGEIVRVDERADVGKLFKAVGVRWALETFNKLATFNQDPPKPESNSPLS